MTIATLSKVNAAIAHKGIELVKGHGYFYFAALATAPADVVTPASVYTTRVTDLSLEDWIAETC